MKNERLIRALTKAGFSVKLNDDFGRLHFAVSGARLIEWHVQGDQAICVKCRRSNDKNDAIVDYHAGSFMKTIKGAIGYLIEGRNESNFSEALCHEFAHIRYAELNRGES